MQKESRSNDKNISMTPIQQFIEDLRCKKKHLKQPVEELYMPIGWNDALDAVINLLENKEDERDKV